MSVRFLAAKLLYHVVFQGQSLSNIYPPKEAISLSSKDQSLLQALLYGSLRWFLKYETVANELFDKPLAEKHNDLLCLIVIGLYQLSQMRIQAHAAVNETVNACVDLTKPWAKGLVNAVLRNYQRMPENQLKDFDDNLVIQTAHPQWLIQLLQKDWPNDYENILKNNNAPANMTLRVNQKMLSRDDYAQKLSAADIAFELTTYSKTGIRLTHPMPVENLPDFALGLVSVQDEAAQLATELLDLKPGQRVLDACAAPGGKTCHILEREPKIETLVALDQDAKRLEKCKDNLSRLNLKAKTIVAKAQETQQWWDEKLFDRILIDAPCSGTGVIRRHPDIKFLRQESDFESFSQIQSALLLALWPLLKPGGKLVYSTCSVMKMENEGVIEKFLSGHIDALIQSINAECGRQLEFGRQIFSSESGMDGFYYACFSKEN